MGFTLKEITLISQLHDSILENRDGQALKKYKQFATVAKDRLGVVEEKIARLQAMRDQLQSMFFRSK